MYRHILIPTNGSPLSAKAIEQGTGLATFLGAKVTGRSFAHSAASGFQGDQPGGRWNMGKRILIAAFALAAFASAAWAAEEYGGTFCGHVKRNVLESNADLTVVATETWAIQTPTSTFKPWENATVHCVGYQRILQGKFSGKGSCRWVDSTGDMFIGESEDQPGKPGVWTFLGGTGKWTGIQGSGTYQRIIGSKPAADGSVEICISHSGKYTLP